MNRNKTKTDSLSLYQLFGEPERWAEEYHPDAALRQFGPLPTLAISSSEPPSRVGLSGGRQSPEIGRYFQTHCERLSTGFALSECPCPRVESHGGDRSSRTAAVNRAVRRTTRGEDACSRRGDCVGSLHLCGADRLLALNRVVNGGPAYGTGPFVFLP